METVPQSRAERALLYRQQRVEGTIRRSAFTREIPVTRRGTAPRDSPAITILEARIANRYLQSDFVTDDKARGLYHELVVSTPLAVGVSVRV
jgi:hypothetical protein